MKNNFFHRRDQQFFISSDEKAANGLENFFPLKPSVIKVHSVVRCLKNGRVYSEKVGTAEK